MQKQIEFRLERETKNTYRFEEVGKVPAVGTLYVQKHVFGDAATPARVLVTIETAE